MTIPFLDLKLINKQHQNHLIESFQETLDSGWYIMGQQVSQFESEFSNYIGSKYCIGVANGLDALNLILRANKELGRLKEGDEIAVPANTYIATILAILENRMKPLLIEPILGTYNIDPEDLQRKITHKTKGVMVVHLYGAACDMDKISDICISNGLLLFEDCAQSQGASFNRKMTGNWGQAAGFSFYPGKNLGALGDAGAITTSDEELNSVVRQIRNYGSKVKYHNEFIGVNSRLDEVQAGFLRKKLPLLNSENAQRREIAKEYLNRLNNPKVTLSKNANNDANVWHVFPVRVETRDNFQNYLKDHLIDTVIHYPIPPHKQKALVEYNDLNLPMSEKIHREIISLPIYPYMPKDHVDKIIEAVNSY